MAAPASKLDEAGQDGARCAGQEGRERLVLRLGLGLGALHTTRHVRLGTRKMHPRNPSRRACTRFTMMTRHGGREAECKANGERFVARTLLMSDLWICGMTPPPAMVACARGAASEHTVVMHRARILHPQGGAAWGMRMRGREG